MSPTAPKMEMGHCHFLSPLRLESFSGYDPALQVEFPLTPMIPIESLRCSRPAYALYNAKGHYIGVTTATILNQHLHRTLSGHANLLVEGRFNGSSPVHGYLLRCGRFGKVAMYAALIDVFKLGVDLLSDEKYRLYLLQELARGKSPEDNRGVLRDLWTKYPAADVTAIIAHLAVSIVLSQRIAKPSKSNKSDLKYRLTLFDSVVSERPYQDPRGVMKTLVSSISPAASLALSILDLQAKERDAHNEKLRLAFIARRKAHYAKTPTPVSPPSYSVY